MFVPDDADTVGGSLPDASPIDSTSSTSYSSCARTCRSGCKVRDESLVANDRPTQAFFHRVGIREGPVRSRNVVVRRPITASTGVETSSRTKRVAARSPRAIACLRQRRFQRQASRRERQPNRPNMRGGDLCHVAPPTPRPSACEVEEPRAACRLLRLAASAYRDRRRRVAIGHRRSARCGAQRPPAHEAPDGQRAPCSLIERQQVRRQSWLLTGLGPSVYSCTSAVRLRWGSIQARLDRTLLPSSVSQARVCPRSDSFQHERLAGRTLRPPSLELSIVS